MTIPFYYFTCRPQQPLIQHQQLQGKVILPFSYAITCQPSLIAQALIFTGLGVFQKNGSLYVSCQDSLFKGGKRVGQYSIRGASMKQSLSREVYWSHRYTHSPPSPVCPEGKISRCPSPTLDLYASLPGDLSLTLPSVVKHFYLSQLSLVS